MADSDDAAGGSRRAASMADVAAHAGVSASTVSRVSSGVGHVSAARRDLVLASMRALGYRPNGAARALKRGSFRTIGVVTHTLSTLGDVRMIEAIALAAAGHGYTTTLIPVHAAFGGDEDGSLSRMQELAVDALLLLNIGVDVLESAGFAAPMGAPVVLLGTAPDGVHPLVATDQADGGRRATEHLLARGHRTVHHIAGPASSYPAARRAQAWRAALEAAGAPVPEPSRGDWSVASGFAAGRVLAADPDCTAVFCANDQMALGLYHAVREAGRDLPGGMSVVGFDDTPDAAAYDPPLSSVRQDFGAAARAGVELAVAAVDAGEEPAPTTTAIPIRLVERESSAPTLADAR